MDENASPTDAVPPAATTNAPTDQVPPAETTPAPAQPQAGTQT
jgi:hypothetical protein